MPWLGQAWQRIQQRLADDRLPHALVIAGERGVGKRAFADALARLRLCDRPVTGASGHPVACGQCKQCELTAAGSHPDVRVYAPEKSRMVKVSQVRELSAFAVASPQVAHHKVAIIDRADQLNINAANALLKTLEEPQADTTLLLVQESGRPLLPTIRSRCQMVALPLPAMDEGQAWVARQGAVTGAESGDGSAPDPDAIRRALLLSGGAPRLALEYLTGDFIGLRDQAFEAFRQFMKGQVPVTEAARAFKALGLEATLTLFEEWAADLARLSAGGEPRDPDAADMLRFLAGRHPPWAAQHLLDAVREARAAGVYNANPELEASRLLFAWQALMPGRRAG